MRTAHGLNLLAAVLLAGCASSGGVATASLFAPASDPDVQAAIALPSGVSLKPIRLVKPEPSVQNLRGKHLSVALDAVVTAEGRVKVIGIKESNDRSFAIACVRSWTQSQFEPVRTAEGKTVAVRTAVTCSQTEQ